MNFQDISAIGGFLSFSRRDLPSLIAEVKRIVGRDGCAYIRGFPPEPDALFDFARMFGPVSMKRAFHNRVLSGGTQSSDYIGDIRLRLDIAKEKRSETQDHEPIGMHTARAFASERPRYFGLLMKDTGWTDLPFGRNGESLLLRLRDVLREFPVRYPKSWEEDIRLLRLMSVQYRPAYYAETATREPILFDLPEGGLGIRFWNSFMEAISSVFMDTPANQAFLGAAQRLSDIIRESRQRILFRMQPGDLYIIDNWTVLHGRMKFESHRCIDDQAQTTSRQLYSVHMSDAAGDASMFAAPVVEQAVAQDLA